MDFVYLFYPEEFIELFSVLDSESDEPYLWGFGV